MRTNDGWLIENLVTKAVYQTGSAFSTGYTVRHDDGRLGFLKALDFSDADRAPDKMRALEELTRMYNFERDVLELCKGENLSKVVVAINNGSIKVPSAPFGEVFYLIFELADGDVRKHAVLNSNFDCLWKIRAIHHISIGISQLHTHGIYHQDIKPSNILVFGSQNTSKLADLGRAHCKTIEAPHDWLAMPGARTYAPPEQLYNFQAPDRAVARAAADLYLLGSVTFFMFTGVMLTPWVVNKLRPEHRPPIFAADDGGWRGYFEDVLPYLESAYGEAIQEFSIQAGDRLKVINEPSVAEELTALFGYLAEPDPRKRGHPQERALKHGNPFDLRRFISTFDRLAARVEFRFKKFDAKAA